jgi:hypothetical protein
MPELSVPNPSSELTITPEKRACGGGANRAINMYDKYSYFTLTTILL